ncbi:hypothetical protein DNTS_012372 [Danionella cerebrum]|uniref:RING-type E3 ubiquitin transferase n=1 Tax=Danionella cerebrum TaxID=2873325 RepID=A0A553RA82_9TELE|nr:hypothetical protein DNTS_012372 [Danionella translucida]
MAESLSSALKQKEKKRSSKDVPPIMSLTEELQCSVCLDVFTDPVSIPCGHSFCQSCLKRFWDVSENCFCPFCKEPFHQRPELKINRALREVIQLFVKKPGLNTSNVPCDVCDKRKQEALKSCLVCQISFCETHLEPHLRVPGLKKHKLINAVEKIADYICQEHERVLELYCREDQMFLCQTCSLTDHKNHKTVSLEEENGLKKTKVIKLQTDVQKMIEDRMKKVLDIKHAADHRKQNMEEEKAESLEIFSALIRSNELFQVEHLEMMEQKQRAAEKQEEELIGDLEREISELKRRNAELEKLSHSEDQFQLIRIFPSLHKPFNFRTSSEISSDTRLTVGTLRRALDPLLETLQEKEKLLVETELKKMKLFADQPSYSHYLREEFHCLECLDVFTDPVYTPCGHSFCQSCLNRFWDNRDYCFCPICKEPFTQRPERITKVVMIYSDLELETDVPKMIEDRMKTVLDIKREAERRKNFSELSKNFNFRTLIFFEPHLTGWTLRKALDPLLDTVEEKLVETVDVTLDPETAHPKLILSPDGKQVSHGGVKQNVPENPKRFVECVSVLGKDGFCLGRFYFEVQVKHKTHWDLGVARESVQRKGDIKPTPQNGIWSIWLRNGNEFEALEDPSVRLFLKTQLQRVGVLVDYEEGLVSFYEVESKSHIYSFTGQTFTEKLYTSVQA